MVSERSQRITRLIWHRVKKVNIAIGNSHGDEGFAEVVTMLPKKGRNYIASLTTTM